MAREVYILAGGGTGGHLCPGIAVSQAIASLSDDANIVFACSGRQIDRTFLDPLDWAIVPQVVAPIPRRVRQVIPFLRAWKASRRNARQMISDLKPKAVLGLGGYAAGPVVREAARAGIKAGMLNPDGVPGRANRYLSRHVGAVFTQFESTGGSFGRSCQSKIHHVGCPVRSTVISTTSLDDAFDYFNLKRDRKVLLVLGGSQGAANINNAIAGLGEDFELLADKWQLLHVTGPGSESNLAGGSFHSTAIKFCDRMDLAYQVADLVLARGGASTIGELSSCHLPAVIMPYPYHKDNQQYGNARALLESGAGTICEDHKQAEANSKALRNTLLPIMKEENLLDAMQANAKAAGLPDAAMAVAKWLVNEQ